MNEDKNMTAHNHMTCMIAPIQTSTQDLTCFDSTAAVYSRPKLSSVMETSSKMMLKSLARSVSSWRISRDTCWRCVISWEALNLATTLFSTCAQEVQTDFKSYPNTENCSLALPNSACRAEKTPKRQPVNFSNTWAASHFCRTIWQAVRVCHWVSSLKISMGHQTEIPTKCLTSTGM